MGWVLEQEGEGLNLILDPGCRALHVAILADNGRGNCYFLIPFSMQTLTSAVHPV